MQVAPQPPEPHGQAEPPSSPKAPHPRELLDKLHPNRIKDRLKVLTSSKGKSKSCKVSVSKNERKKLHALFHSLDTEGDGCLSASDLESDQFEKSKIDSDVIEEIVRLAKQRCAQSGDGCLEIDEFLDIALVDKPSIFVRYHKTFDTLACLVFFAIAPLVYIPHNVDDDGNKWLFWRSLHFAAQTVTTVGYGDSPPVNDQMKIVTVFYILFGLALVGGIVSEVASAIVSHYEEKMELFHKKAMATVAATSKAAASAASPASAGVKAAFRETKMGTLAMEKIATGTATAEQMMTKVGNRVDRKVTQKLWMSTLLFAFPISVGTLFYAYNEEWSYVDAFYWSVVTCTTVGYGDMSLEKESSYAFSFFYILIGVAFLGASIGNLGTIQMEKALAGKMANLFSLSMTSELITQISIEGGGIDRGAFVCATLLQLELVTAEDLTPLLMKFSELDTDGSGLLTKEDLKALKHSSKRAKASKGVAQAWQDNSSKQASGGGDNAQILRLIESLKSFTEDSKSNKGIPVGKSVRKMLEDLFHELDDDQDGHLTQDELKKGQSKRLSGGSNDKMCQEALVFAIERADRNGDGVLDIDEFLSIWLVEQPSFIQRHHKCVDLAVCIFFFAIAPAVYIPLNPLEDGSHWSVWDALYFASQTVTTVGYGDKPPNNDEMKLFTVAYIVFALCIVADIVNNLVGAVVAHYEAKMQQFHRTLADTMVQTSEALANKSKTTLDFKGGLPGMDNLKKMALGNRAIMWKLWTSVLLFMFPISIGIVFFKYNEGWSTLDAFYWSVMTCTTVGFGDLSLEKESSRAFSVFYILIGVSFAAASIGNIGTIQMEMALKKKKHDLLSQALSTDLISEFDQDGNGVDRCEFVCGMLLQLGTVSEDDLLPILSKFDELDADGSGYLTMDDLKLLRAQKRKTMIEGSPTGVDPKADASFAQVVPAAEDC